MLNEALFLADDLELVPFIFVELQPGGICKGMLYELERLVERFLAGFWDVEFCPRALFTETILCCLR